MIVSLNSLFFSPLKFNFPWRTYIHTAQSSIKWSAQKHRFVLILPIILMVTYFMGNSISCDDLRVAIVEKMRALDTSQVAT